MQGLKGSHLAMVLCTFLPWLKAANSLHGLPRKSAWQATKPKVPFLMRHPTQREARHVGGTQAPCTTAVELRQARVRESSVLTENMWLNIVFQNEHSSLSLSLLFNYRCGCTLPTSWLGHSSDHPHLAWGPSMPHPTHWLSIGNYQVLPFP
jgi:hypothetical protein